MRNPIRAHAARRYRPATAAASLALALAAGACVAHAGAPVSPARVPHEPLALRLEDPTAWRRLVVLRSGFSKRLSFEEPAAGARWEIRYKGVPISWMSPVNIVVPERIYGRRSHRGRFRFEHPLTREPMLLRARARSQSVGTVPLPPGSDPVVEVLGAGGDAVRGHLAYDVRSLVLFRGALGGMAVEVHQLGEGVRRPVGPLEHLLAPFPLAGEFAVLLDGGEAARFVKQPQHGTITEYELALRNDLGPAVTDQAALAFVVFALMEDFVESAVP
jgi:hypothetical protein